MICHAMIRPHSWLLICINETCPSRTRIVYRHESNVRKWIAPSTPEIVDWNPNRSCHTLRLVNKVYQLNTM